MNVEKMRRHLARQEPDVLILEVAANHGYDPEEFTRYFERRRDHWANMMRIKHKNGPLIINFYKDDLIDYNKTRIVLECVARPQIRS